MLVNLNDKQLEAVKYVGGPLLIIAGAGTGKTAVITQRIIHLINEKLAKPNEILALTFTEKAAAEMAERVDIAMPMGYQEPQISTFHSFCDKILKQEGSFIGLDTNFKLLSGAQSYILFRKHLYELPLDKFRPLGNPTSFIGDILAHFSRLQDEAVLPEEYIEFAKALREDDLADKYSKEEYLELANVYKAYSDAKVANSRLDFGDLIILTLRLFKEKPNILEKYRKLYKYILIDEYQDTNFTQNLLVNMLALGVNPDKATKAIRNTTELTVVGDDDQSIYKFRGAAISNILQFKETYPKAKRIVLTDNYRSRQEILDSSYQLVTHNNPYRLEVTEEVDKQLKSRVDGEKNRTAVQLMLADTVSNEAEGVAKEILRLTGNKERLKDDSEIVDRRFDDRGQSMFIDVADEKAVYSFKDIAILVRANTHADEFIQSLKFYGIPFKHAGPKGLYSRPEVSILISFLKTVADRADTISFFNIIKMPQWGFSPREIVELMRLSKKDRTSPLEWIENQLNAKIGAELKSPDLGGEETVESSHFVHQVNNSELINKTFSQNSVASLVIFIEIYNRAYIGVKEGLGTGAILFEFFKSSGYLDQLLAEDTFEAQFKVQNIGKFFELIKNYETDNPDSNIFEYVDFLQYSIDIGENPKVDQDLLDDYNAVTISTIHSSKGLEYPVVFLVNLVKGRFPSQNRSDKIAIPEGLVKESPTELDESESHIQEERRLAYVAVTRAKQKLYLTAASLYGEKGRKSQPSLFLNEILNRKIVGDDFPLVSGSKIPTFATLTNDEDQFGSLSSVTSTVGDFVSYSQLDTYSNCPKKYKYQYILNLTEPDSHVFSYGNTIHATLKKFYEKYNMDGQLTGLEELSPASADVLVEIFTQSWVGGGYESKKHEEVRKEFGAESMKKFYEKMYLADDKVLALETPFKLNLENTTVTGRIDRIDLIGETDGVKVVNLIDYKSGKVKRATKSDKNFNLQLAIYALAAERVMGFKVSKVGLWFVEHGEKVEYEITEKIKNDGLMMINSFIKQMKSGDFNPKPDMFGCKFCAYKEICEDAFV
jgi:DNA helicase II / ATP-dependent DNA helicase PcrA